MNTMEVDVSDNVDCCTHEERCNMPYNVEVIRSNLEALRNKVC